MSELIGRRIGPYEVREQIGQGGMATVYRAYQTSLNRYVAIKVLPTWMAQDSQFVQRFRQEALAAGGLRHPNILAILDAGTFEGQHYIVMDYVSGGTLADHFRRNALSPDQAGDLIAQVADALDYAHRRGIVHRDIKPSNILMDEDGRPLLADFGIAQAMGSGPRLTQTNTSVGTPEYMSPEQSQGERVDGRSDIYSLGIVLYQMLTGRVPFQSTTPVATLYQVVHEPPPPPRLLNPAIPAYLESIVLRCLAKQPEQRFATAKELADALRQRRLVPPVAAAAAETQLMAAGPATPAVAASRRAGGTAGPATPPHIAATPPAKAKRSGGTGVLVGVLSLLIVGLLGGGIYLVVSSGGLSRQRSAATPTAAVVSAAATPAPASPTPTPAVTVVEKVVIATNTVTLTPLPPTQTPMVVVVTVLAPTATPLPTPTATPTETPRPAAAARPAATAAPAKPGVVLDFDNFGSWRRGDEPYGTFVQSSERKHDGATSGKLAYDIPAVDKHYVVFERVPALAIPGQPTALTLWVYGDGSNHYLNAWIQDSAGEVRQFTFGQIRHADAWQPMVAALDPKAPWPQGHISGPDNNALDYPISFRGLVLDVVPKTGATKYTGAIFVDDLTTGATTAAGTAPAPASAGSTPAGQATAAAPAPSGPLTGQIVYAAANGGATDVMILDVASKGARTLFPNARQPDIRKDGCAVVNGIGGGKDNIFTINADGSRETMSGKHPEDSYPHWSPSGESATFQSTIGDGKERIYVQWDMSHAEEPKVVTVNGVHVYGRAPTWLPNWRIAFSGCNYWANGGNCGIWTINSNNSGAAQQLTERVEDRSSDSAGDVLLYSSSVSGNWEIYAIPVNGGAARNLTNSPSQDVGATFSPDGSFIAFISNRDGWGIWVMNADGSNPQKLLTVPTGFGQGWAEERLGWGP
jgi:serine/threonine-protein kinase